MILRETEDLALLLLLLRCFFAGCGWRAARSYQLWVADWTATRTSQESSRSQSTSSTLGTSLSNH